MTLGQLVGPLVGSLSAVAFGYTGAFIAASVIMFSSVTFCYLYVTDIPPLPKKEGTLGGFQIDKRVITGWMLCSIAFIQLTFLPSVLPTVFKGFEIEQTLAVKWAGTVVMLYTGTAMIGSYLLSRLSRKFGLYRMITMLLVFGILFQSLLAFSRGIVDFTVIRMAQTGLIAAAIPLIMSIFAGESKGGVIGFLNSSRFIGNALGPIIGTSVLAFSNLTSLYLFISGITLLGFLCFKLFLGSSEASHPSSGLVG
jgi:DHA1 family multidrug resistance protein-like MFS transporter